MENTRYIVDLIKKSLEDKLSSVDQDQLKAWAQSDDAYQELLNRMHDRETIQEMLLDYHALQQKDLESGSDYTARLYETLNSRVNKTDKISSSRIQRIRSLLPYAAAICIVVAGVWYLTKQNLQQTDYSLELKEADKILPGENRASLYMADGKVVQLSADQEGIVVGERIFYLDGSSVLNREEDHEQVGTINYDYILNTPKGGTYQITLSDGTRVWLNAASTLKYPKQFTDKERIVELEGEAFFEVHRARFGAGSSPFLVRTNHQMLKVLGTRFNISAYQDEMYTKTTLVDGAVQVINLRSNKINQIKPGEQSSIQGAITEIQSVDVTRYTDWKNGEFNFNGKTLPEVLKELERWYDVTVMYEGKIPQIEFEGNLPRNLPFSSMLNILKGLQVEFQLEEGRRLIIHEQ